MNEELIMKAQILEQQANEVEQAREAISQQISELEAFKESLSGFNSNQKEIFSSLGKGLYVKTNLVDKDLLVNVGAGIYVKKSAKETSEVIINQLKRLKEVRMELMAKSEAYARAFQEILMEFQEEQRKAQKK